MRGPTLWSFPFSTVTVDIMQVTYYYRSYPSTRKIDEQSTDRKLVTRIPGFCTFGSYVYLKSLEIFPNDTCPSANTLQLLFQSITILKDRYFLYCRHIVHFGQVSWVRTGCHASITAQMSIAWRDPRYRQCMVNIQDTHTLTPIKPILTVTSHQHPNYCFPCNPAAHSYCLHSHYCIY